MAETSVLLSGDLLSGGQEYRVHLSPDGLHWQLTNQKKDSTEVSLPWSDIYSLVTDGQGETTQMNGEGKSFTIHFITHRRDKKWKATEKKFDVKEGDVSDWVRQIQANYRPATPKRLLVIVNPIGGKGQGRQVYEKKVAPLFKTAGIETHVFITERAKHSEEIINNFDFSKVEGLVTVGGDGMYQEALNTLIQRNQKEAGIDINNPESVLKPLDIKFGIIPAGTGNGVSALAAGVIDIETAILHVIRGETIGFNIFGIYEPGKLLSYSGLLFAHGFSSAIIKKTDEKRWMKTFRYPYVMITHSFSKKQVYEPEIHLLEKTAGDDSQEIAESEGAAAPAKEKGWRRLEAMQQMDMMIFICKIDTKQDKLKMLPSSDSFTVFLTKLCAGWTYLKMMFGLMRQSSDAMDVPQLVVHQDVTGMKVKFNIDENPSLSEKEKMYGSLLNIDGELYKSECGEVEIRLISRYVPMYATPVDSFSSTPGEDPGEPPQTA
ncbi:ceramide kinase-like [Haliotis rubra]|uniref:ceramide kinase-like n=1 Tax=Haliotis rubra TaxID=36100 RepID=UPI001EE6327C|nr:ceramide kinase-like [Haliotis rubra]